jgi:hypothetical protein
VPRCPCCRAPRRPDGPGQFAFADDGRVRRILEESGWSDVAIEPIDIPCAFPEGELIAYLTRVGPVSRLLGEMSESGRARIIDAIRPAFDPYVRDAEVRFDAACWMVDATASSLPQGADHD